MHDLHFLSDAPIAGHAPELGASEPHEQLVTAAMLAATAFRMKDMPGLLYALRALVRAVGDFERVRDAA